MEVKDLRDLVEFADGAPVHRTLYESPHLWSEVLCLERNQRHGPISDPGSDGVFVVMAGEVVVQIGRHRKRLGQWGAVFAPAATEVSVVNASTDPAVVLVVAAPPPVPDRG